MSFELTKGETNDKNNIYTNTKKPLETSLVRVLHCLAINLKLAKDTNLKMSK